MKIPKLPNISKETIKTIANRAQHAGVLGGGIAGGWYASSKMITSTHRADLLGDPSRIVDNNNDVLILRQRQPQAGILSNSLMGIGAVSSFAGTALAFSGAESVGKLASTRVGLGAALFGLGAGAIAGASATTRNLNGSDFLPNHGMVAAK